MPIIVDTKLNAPTKERFQQIDYKLMGEAFAVHNTLGQLMDEACYRKALSLRLSNIGFQNIQEMEIKLTHKNHSKSYYIDLLIDDSIIIELKALDALHPKHEAQVINYLLLCELPHGKLINFGTSSVESRFISTKLKRADRSKFSFNTTQWHPESEICKCIPDLLDDLLADWGTHLNFELYESALHHLLKIRESQVGIYNNQQLLGHKKMYLTAKDTALLISGIKGSFTNYKQHIQRIIANTTLQTIQWINIYRSQITLTTVKA
tara:strand:- start:161 stop:952 length:792 start_codon:yes stop_codon:yes gene_type:complete